MGKPWGMNPNISNMHLIYRVNQFHLNWNTPYHVSHIFVYNILHRHRRNVANQLMVKSMD